MRGEAQPGPFPREAGARDLGELFRLKAVIEYDGTDYLGFQRQAEGPTIQGVLEETLRGITGQGIRVLGAGRTDAGVHATGQVVACDLTWKHPLGDLQNALNALLPRSIAVRELDLAPPAFHPRFDARSREYRYRILNRPVRSPLEERFAHHVPAPLDVAAMNEAAAPLLGVHDFASFGQPTQGAVTLREVLAAHWERQGELVVFRVEANGFLRGMVRSLVGTLLEVGLGKADPQWVRRVLEARDRSQAGQSAPARGLFLVRVRYDQAGQRLDDTGSGQEPVSAEGVRWQ